MQQTLQCLQAKTHQGQPQSLLAERCLAEVMEQTLHCLQGPQPMIHLSQRV